MYADVNNERAVETFVIASGSENWSGGGIFNEHPQKNATKGIHIKYLIILFIMRGC